MSDDLFRLPGDDEHVAIMGRNGSGKTQFGIWLLSQRSFHKMPWYVLAFKPDPLIDNIPGRTEVKLTDPIHSRPGIYVARPLVVDKKGQEQLDDFFFRIWKHENVGVHVDEGYMATGLKWFRACLAQGRSKRVPLSVISQRPVYMDRFVWSEASRFCAFDLNIEDDRLTAAKSVPGYAKVQLDTLPPFHSVWHDVKSNQTMILRPCPDEDTILSEFRAHRPYQRRVI